MSGEYLHCTGNGEEYTLKRTIFSVVRTGDVVGDDASRGEGVHGSHGTGELEGAEGVEGAIWKGSMYTSGSAKMGLIAHLC